MRISDWSSDVCSSDLVAAVVPAELGQAEARQAVRADRVDREQFLDLGGVGVGDRLAAARDAGVVDEDRYGGEVGLDGGDHRGARFLVGEIGRASCRERVCQYV